MRCVLFASGMLLLLPVSAIPHGVILNLVGLGIGGLILGSEYLAGRRLKAVG